MSIKKLTYKLLPESLKLLMVDKLKTQKECSKQYENMQFFDSLDIEINTQDFVCVICHSRRCVNIKYSYQFDNSIVKHKCLYCGHLQPAYDFHFLESNSYDFKPYFPDGELKLIDIALKHTKNGRLLVIGGGGGILNI